MNTRDRSDFSEPAGEGGPPATAGQSAAAPADFVSERAGHSPGRVAGPLVLIGAGLLAGVLGGFLADGCLDYFGISPELHAEYEKVVGNPPMDLVRRHLHEQTIADYKNLALVIGLLGAILCGSIGLLDGLARQSGRGAMIGLLGGAAIGALFGAAGGLADHYVSVRIPLGQMEEIYRTMLMHGAAWVPVGIAAGLIAGLPGRPNTSLPNCLAGAIGAALIAAGLYPFLSASLFALDQANQPIPSGPTGFWNRIVWMTFTAVLITLAVGRIRSKHRSPNVSQPT